MFRRLFLKVPSTLWATLGPLKLADAQTSSKETLARMGIARVRPADHNWPTETNWTQLGEKLKGKLIRVRSPLAECIATPTSNACEKLFKAAKNPYYLSDEIGLTQTLGWVNAWTSKPSVYAVEALSTQDVVAAVNFARDHNLRLVVKGGGHSYQGTSNAPDSLLIRTRKMAGVKLHQAFIGSGCEANGTPMRAVSVEAGALWAQAYDAVTTQAGGFVQGGGCMTVGVAGLVLSGGFGSFSKAFGLAAGNLLEAEVITADGMVRIANACTHADLFWGLKGGGGGSLGIVTRVTLRVHDLPENFGAVNITVKASTASAFRRLVSLMMDFYSEKLLNPHWGEQIRFRPDNSLKISMVFQGLTRSEAQRTWKPFLDTLDQSPKEFEVEFAPLKIVSTSARTFWSPTLIKRLLGFIATDDRPGAPTGNVFWPGDQGQAGQVLHAYQSQWLPVGLLQAEKQQALCDALYEASRHWNVSLHVNKGLAGASAAVVAEAKNTAMNPAVLDAFALAICGANGPPAYPGILGHEPDEVLARKHSQAITQAMGKLKLLVPNASSYLAESDYFEANWQKSFWGENYPRLLSVKTKYDPTGLFFVHHGVGSEAWSDDGFVRT